MCGLADLMSDLHQFVVIAYLPFRHICTSVKFSNFKFILMVFDLDLIKKVYAEMPGKVEAARQADWQTTDLTEKILYAHLYGAFPASLMTAEKIM